MKPRIAPRPQPDSIVIRLRDPAALAALEQDAALVRIMLINDPAYAAWSEARQIENEASYDAWLTSPEGERWLEEQARYDAFKRNGYHPMESWDFEAIGA